MPLRRMITTLLLLLSGVCFAETFSWQGALQDGSRITIDPDTNKVTRTADGVSSPLWDGVHSLDNGAVIIVRNGVVIKDVAIIEAQREQERDRLNAACMQLVKKVCGAHNECEAYPACDPARQLLAMEREELNESWAGMVLETSTHCLEGLGNEVFFKPCNKRRAGDETACEKLRAKVCGEEDQCSGGEACSAARQLVAMEHQDRYSVPGGFTYATAQCRDALVEGADFFRSCE